MPHSDTGERVTPVLDFPSRDASTPRQRNPRRMTYVTPPRPHPADAPTPGLVMGQ
jgi:hypothetical protein